MAVFIKSAKRADVKTLKTHGKHPKTTTTSGPAKFDLVNRDGVLKNDHDGERRVCVDTI